MLARKKTPVDIRKRDVEACVLTPSIPAGRCVGAVWVAYWACQRYHHLCLSQQAISYIVLRSISRTKEMLFQAGCFGCGEFSGCSEWHEFVILFPLPLCRFERYAAHRKPPLFALCCKKQQQQKTPRAQQYTSSLVIPCAHEKLNVKHHRTTPKPAIHTGITAEKDEAALARK